MINKRKWSYAFEKLRHTVNLEERLQQIMDAEAQAESQRQEEAEQTPDIIDEELFETSDIDIDDDLEIDLSHMSMEKALQLFEGTNSKTDTALLAYIKSRDLEDDSVCKQMLQHKKFPKDPSAEFWLPYFAHMGVPLSGANVLATTNLPANNRIC
jgi:hypothetical protein